jgi:hypothetical protein
MYVYGYGVVVWVCIHGSDLAQFLRGDFEAGNGGWRMEDGGWRMKLNNEAEIERLEQRRHTWEFVTMC